MIEVPTRERDGSVPFGVLYAASAALRHGHRVKILDLVKEDLSDEEIILQIKQFAPGLIGMGGITSSYGRCKELVALIKQNFSGIPIVAGGVLSSVVDLLLTRAGVDYVVHGEAELSFPKLIQTLEEQGDVSRVAGISFVWNGVVNRTESERLLKDLDEIPMPVFELLKMNRYLETLDKWIDHYLRIEDDINKSVRKVLAGKRYMFPIITARGCTHKCIFCYRHHRGLRQHSVGYVVAMIRHLHETYGVDVFQINDELTTGSKAWVREFCAALKAEKLPIALIILSARVDNVDAEILSLLKEVNCIMINYGYESGANAILKEIRKGVTREEALETGLLTKQAGIINIPEIIIGFPSKTRTTVEETIDFLKQLDTWSFSINTPIPFPGTPLWEHAVRHGLIKDEEEFVLGYRRGLFINFTKFSDRELLSLVAKVHYDPYLSWLKRRGHFLLYLKTMLVRIFAVNLRQVIPGGIFAGIRMIYHRSGF